MAGKIWEALNEGGKLTGKDLKKAKALLSELEKETEPTQPELVRLRAIIKRLEIIGR